MGIFSKAVCSPQNFMLISQLSVQHRLTVHTQPCGHRCLEGLNTLINTWSYGLRRQQKVLMILKCFLTFPSRALFPAGACNILMSF